MRLGLKVCADRLRLARRLQLFAMLPDPVTNSTKCYGYKFHFGHDCFRCGVHTLKFPLMCRVVRDDFPLEITVFFVSGLCGLPGRIASYYSRVRQINVLGALNHLMKDKHVLPSV